MLMLDTPDSKRITMAELQEIEVPLATKSYCPVPHKDIIDLVLNTMETTLPLALRDVRVGVAAKGQEMFGVAEFDGTGDYPWGFAAGFRNSYNKQVSAGVCFGAHVFVCSNLCFRGDGITVMRKHTTNIWGDLQDRFAAAAESALSDFQGVSDDLASFRGIHMEYDWVAAALGVMFNRGIIRSGELIKALNYFKHAPHEEHRTNDLFAFYQGVNHALKGASPSRAMSAHAHLHEFAVELREVDGIWQPPVMLGEAK
ncbi:MAG: hypothetical protein Unbinned4944contig1000_36 [Prokaryotic dsDNA virus sp.]|nr:MAG: hypothetical protein Unbinned4944contig1000_36 [Prokaryotic dsDNA virus sp.]|tara:strand:+ start:5152 stop:5919 length:768 start_codon:yes stop_codon:yes gene_type:complete